MGNKKTKIDKLLDKLDVQEHYIDYCSNCGEKINGQIILKKDLKKILNADKNRKTK